MNDSTDERPERSLPDSPLFALLRALVRKVSVAGLDRVWVFPPRRVEAGETALVVAAAFLDPGSDRRRVHVAHYTLPAEAPEPRLALDEFGTAPVERLGRVVEDVLERAGEGFAAPRAHRIDGDPHRWHELLHDLAEQQLREAVTGARPRRDPRPRLTGKNFRPRGRT